MKPQILCFVLLAAAAEPAAAQRLVASHPPARTTPVALARINGVVLTAERVELQLQGLIPRTSFHRNIRPERMTELRAQALELAIDEELQFQEATRLRFVVTTAEVEAGLNRARRRYPSRAAFDSARRSAGVTLKEVRSGIRRALLVQKMRKRAVQDKCLVTEAEARRFYRENPQRFVTPERLHLYVITVGVDPSSPSATWQTARTKAETLRREIEAGAKFEDVARRESTDESRGNGGDLGVVHRGRLTDEFENAVRPLGPGEMAPVVQSLRGFHILRLAEILPPESKSYRELRRQLLSDLTAKRCEDQDEAWRRSLRAKASVEMLAPSSSPAAVKR